MPKEKTSDISTGRLGAAFLMAGILSLVFSVYSDSQILMLAGLGLTFWGTLFILVTPRRYVEGSFLETATASEYLTLDRIIKNMGLKEEAFCIPSFPKEGNLPEHLEGLKEMVMFIPEENAEGMVSVDELAKGKFLTEKPKGVLITPPGIGILNKIEQKRKTDLNKMPIHEFPETFLSLVHELNLTKEITMVIKENQAIMHIKDSLYKNLYGQKYHLSSINFLGCPIVNAVACGLAKSSGKPVYVQNIRNSMNDSTMIVTFGIL